MAWVIAIVEGVVAAIAVSVVVVVAAVGLYCRAMDSVDID